MKKFLAMLLSLVMLLGAFSGCAKQTNEKSPGDSSSSKTPPANATYQKSIVCGLGGKIVSLDPQANSNTQHNYYFRMNFDTLIDFDNATGKLLPCLAEKWETEDSKTYVFTLRKDVKFHDGGKFTAEDVKFTFVRGVDSDTSTTLCKLIETMDVTDDTHISITLKQTNVDFPYLLTLPTASILSKAAVEANPTDGYKIGSGPWKTDSFVVGDYLKLTRNDDFWGEKAKAETFTLRYMPDNSARVIALETGEIDLCADPDTLDLDRIRDNSKLELQSYVGSSITYLAMNNKKAPFDDENLRLAMAYGVDPQELIDVVKNGEAQPVKSLWGWNEYGYNGGKTAFTYDVEKAKEYLAKAGYANGGFKFKLSVSAGERKSCAEIIQAQMKKIGVEVEIVEFDSAGLSKSTTNGEHEAALYGCGMNIFGDDARRLICPGTGVNKSHYDNAKVNELMDLAVQEQDDAKRKEYYAEVQQILHDTAGYVPLYFANGFFGVKKGTGGIDYYPTSHHDMSNVYIVVQ